MLLLGMVVLACSLGKAQFIFQEGLSMPSGVTLSTSSDIDMVQSTSGFGIGYRYSTSAVFSNSAVTKLDAQGQHQWTSSVSTVAQNLMPLEYATIATDDGGFLQVGVLFDFSTMYAVKFSSTGSVLWFQAYAQDEFTRNIPLYALEVADGYVMTGEATDNLGPEQRDVFLLKVRKSDGAIMWGKRYVIEDYDEEGTMIAEDSEGNLLVSARTHGSNALLDAYVFKTNSSGTLTWVKTYDFGGNEYGDAIAITPDDGFVLGTNSTTGGNHMYFTHCSTTGAELISRRIDDQVVRDIELTQDGNWTFLHGGTATHRNWLTKFSPSGSSLWTRRYTGPVNPVTATSIDNSNDQGYVFANAASTTMIGVSKADFVGDAKCEGENAEISIFIVESMLRELEPTTLEPYETVEVDWTSASIEPTVDVICCGAGVCPPPNSGINSRFEKHYGTNASDEGYGIMNLDNNGFLLSGATGGGSASRDLLFVATDNYGNYCWSQQYELNAGADEWAMDVAKSPQNALCDAYYFTGYSTMNNRDLIVGQLNGQGIMQWLYNYGSDGLTFGADVDYESAYVNVAGFTTFNGAAQEEGLYLALLPNGVEVANFSYGMDNSDERFYSTIRIGPYFTMVGYTDVNDAATGQDVFLVQTNGNINTNYQFRFGTVNDDIAHDMVLHGNHFYITGRTHDPVNGWDVFLAQVTVSTGALNWFHVFEDGADEYPFALEVDDANGRIYIAGQHQRPQADMEAFVIETDLNGDLVKARIYGGDREEVFHGLDMDQYGRLAAIGSTHSFPAGDQDFYFCKMLDLQTECEDPWIPKQTDLNLTPDTTDGDLGPALQRGTPGYTGSSQLDTFDKACEENTGSGSGSGSGKQALYDPFSSENTGFELFPNPSNNVVTLRYHYGEETERTLEIYDLNGRRLAVQNLVGASGTLEVNTSHLLDGVYLVKVTEANGQLQVKKMMVRH
jgi:hypothetical protein